MDVFTDSTLRRHAFLTARGFEHRDGATWTIEPFDAGQLGNSDQIFTRLYSANRAVWILDRETARALRRPLEIPSTVFDVQRNTKAATYLQMAERISFQPRGKDQKDSLLLFPEKIEQWGIDLDDSDAESIEAAMVRLQDHFGRSLVYPPGRLSTYLMEGIRDRAREQVNFRSRPESFTLFRSINFLDWTRTRPFTEAEQGMGFVHSFDKNAMYLNAAAIALPIGNYRHTANPAITNQPGIWRARIRPLSGCALWNPPGAHNQWVYTPTLLQLQELGLIDEVCEAWISDESHKLFPTWQSRLKKALAGAKAERPEVAELMTRFVKSIYTKGIGYLNSDLFKEEWFFRPDWWGMIVSEAAARTFRDAAQVLVECATIPVATHIDCLYYVSDEPDPYTAFPTFRSAFANKFKWKGTCRLTPEIIAAHGAGKKSGEFAGLIKRGIKAYLRESVKS